MKKSLLAIFALIAMLLTLTSILNAQDVAPEVTYYLADDANGIQQVYQVVLDGEYEAHPITYAESDVITFSPAYDGLGVVYVSDGQLWLQSIHLKEPESVATISATEFISDPIFSQEGQYVAYTDNGVWLLDLSTRETQQILENVALEETASNASEFRIYKPEMFVLDADGKATKLIVDVGVWEWNTVGVYDLATGELQELEGQLHTDLLPLSNGTVLLYGNGGVAGETSLAIADSLDDINTYTQTLNFRSLTESTLYAQQALEIAPNIVRIFGTTINAPIDGATAFYFDYDVETGTGSRVNFLVLPVSSEGFTLAGKLSPDGSSIPVYAEAILSDNNSIQGQFQLLDLATGETTTAQFPETVGNFHWQQ